MKEEELVRGTKQKDENAYRCLVDQYREKVLRTITGLVHNPADAEDLAQEVFIEIYRSIHSFREESKLSTWIYRIAVNKSINFMNFKKRRAVFNHIEEFFTGKKKVNSHVYKNFAQDPSGKLEREEIAKALHHALANLPKNQRIAFTLNKYEDLSYKEIANIMQMKLPAVESLIHRAKINLQKKLIHFYKHYE
ncbi:MAG: RNA polymerase sigma factor [bacterium]